MDRPELPDGTLAMAKPLFDAQRSAQIKKELEAGASDIRQLSAALTERLRWFEDWVAKLPGRVDTTVAGDDPEGRQDWSFCLRLHRPGKAWILSYDYYHEIHGDPNDSNWLPVSDASIEVKIAAAALLPKLFEKFGAAQQILLRRLRESNQGFDTFAREIGMPMPGEGA